MAGDLDFDDSDAPGDEPGLGLADETPSFDNLAEAMSRNAQGLANIETVTEAVKILMQSAGYLKPDQILALQNHLAQVMADLDVPEYGPEFDIKGEMQRLIVLCRTLEKALYDDEGNLKVGMIKDVMGANKNLFELLMKVHPQVMNMDRMRQVEEAHIACLQKLPEPHRSQYLLELRAELKRRGI